MTQSLTPQAQRNVEHKLFLYLSAFSSLCNEYFSQTQSLPKLNTLDLSLVTITIAITITLKSIDCVFAFAISFICHSWSFQAYSVNII